MLLNPIKCIKCKRAYNTIKDSGLFDNQYYIFEYPDVRKENFDPIIHYILYGAKEGRKPTPYFDTQFYLDSYQDVKKSNMNPLYHYIKYGFKEGRNPSPYFNTQFYLDSNADIDSSNMNPLYHYINYGAKEGRNPSENFNTLYYWHNNIDVRKSGMPPLLHFIKYGEVEGRLTRASLDKIEINPSEMPILRVLDSFDTLLEEDFKRHSFFTYFNFKKIFDNLKVSIIMPTYNRAYIIKNAIDSVYQQYHSNWELIIIDDGSTDNTRDVISQYNDSRIKVISGQHRGVSAARNLGLKAATGDYIFYLDSDNSWHKDYLALMLTYLVVDELDCVYSGLQIVDEKGITTAYRGDRFDWNECFKSNYIDLNVFAHKYNYLLDKGLFDESLRRMVDWDLILRYSKNAKIRYLPFIGCFYLDDKSANNRISNSEPYLFRDIVQLKNKLQNKELIAQNLKLTIALKIPAPFQKKDEWGDYHYALAMKSAFEKQGHCVRIDFLEDWYKYDNHLTKIVIVLRGLSKYKPEKGQINILWNISHPDKVTYQEYEDYDIVYLASYSYTNLLKNILPNKNIKPLLQATEPHILANNLVKKDKIIFIGNSRKTYRPLVHWVIELGYDVEVYGNHWEGFIAPKYIKGKYIENSKIKDLYATYKIVLNDHWESMKDFGLVSNRIFDVLSVNGNLISDYVDSAKYIFGDSINMVKSREELSRLLQGGAGNLSNSVSDDVLKYHTFDARINNIIHDIHSFVKIKTDKVVKPLPFENTKKIRVGILTMGGRNRPQSSSFIRLVAPLTSDFMIDKVEIVFWGDNFDRDRILSNNIDVCIVQRMVISDIKIAEELVLFLQSNNIKLVLDSDDAFSEIPETHTEYNLLQKKSQVIKYLANNADAVWLSTEKLSETYSKNMKNRIKILPNGLDPRIWHSKYSKQNIKFSKDIVNFIYMGTATHDHDFYELLYPAFSKLYEKYPGRFTLTIIGAVKNLPGDTWLKIVKVPGGLHIYPRFVEWFINNSADFDVGLSPLVNSTFNKCKTDIKFLDYVGIGILPVLSDIEAYNTVSDINKFAILVKDEEWYDSLEKIIIQNDKTIFNNMIEAGKKYLWESRSVEHISKEQYSSLCSILNISQDN